MTESSNERVSTTLVVPGEQAMVALLGSRDELLRVIERQLDSDVHVRGNEITITGQASDNANAVRLFEELLALIKSGQTLTADSVSRVFGMLTADSTDSPAEVLSLNILSRRGKNIRPKTLNQKRYVDAIDKHTVVFGIGPAGTGKTYLAVAKAVQALLSKEVTRIILTRPAVEAGERLGFLPGTLFDKIDPYLRPLFDALHDMLDPDSLPRLMQAGTIEIAPLAYMRGRAQPLDATVMTPEGSGRIGDLQVGDLVVGSDGLPTPVLGVFPQGRKQVYRVTTQDGASTLACGEHLWTVRTVDDRSHGRGWRTLQTQDMIGNLRRGHVHRYELPVVAPVEFVPTPVPMDPYALGLLLGDGCLTGSSTPSFSTADPELAEALQAALPAVTVRHKSGPDYVLTSGRRGGVITENHVTGRLRELQLLGTYSHTKFVPPEYLVNSAETRLAVLQGLLDSDGQSTSSGLIELHLKSPRLLKNVVWLVQSLGGTATRHEGVSSALDIRLPPQLQPFRLARKQAKYDATGGGRPMRFITSIEPVGETETVCIQVGAQDSLYVTDDFVVTHNTLNDAFIILDEAQNTTPEQMKMFLTRLGFGSRVVVTGDVTQVDLPGNQRSGLRVVRDILGDVDDIYFANLNSKDVVRHRLVGEIVDAYERHDANAQQGGGGRVHRS